MTRPKHTREAVAVTVGFTTTMTELLEVMGIAITPGSRAAMWARISNYGIDASHWERSAHARRLYPDDGLRSAVAASTTMTEVMRLLGMKLTGGSHSHLKRRIQAAGIDTSHFLGQAHNRGKPGRRRPANEVLVILPVGSPRPKGSLLKRAMLESGLTYECALCSLGPMWRDQALNLAIDHIDGDWLNNLLQNLRFLCPNCHAQTSTWCRRKRPAATP